MREVRAVDPLRCRLWENHGRLEEYLTEESCKAEIESFVAHGQLIPVLARRVRRPTEYDFEVICGARRLFVARHLNVPLQAEIRDLTDREAVIALDIENSQRQEMSAYERGRAFARWLAEGYFKSQDETAAVLGMSASQVSKLLKIGRLPSVIVNAFGKPADICETWGLDLALAWSDESKRPKMAAKARRMAAQKKNIEPVEVHAQLMTSSQLKEDRMVKSRDEVVFGADGKALFRIRHHEQTVAVVIRTQKLSSGPMKLSKIRQFLLRVLQDENAQIAESIDEREQTPSTDIPCSSSALSEDPLCGAPV